jgi:hypothetical protein
MLGGDEPAEDAYAQVLDPFGATQSRADAITLPAPRMSVVPRQDEREAKSGESPPSSGAFRDLGSFQCVPRVVRTPCQIRQAKLDHRQAFVLCLIDGRVDVEAILDTCPLPMHDVLGILRELVWQGLIDLD